MVESQSVSLELATPDQAGLSSNLLALYIHDLSVIFPIDVGTDTFSSTRTSAA